MRADVTRLRLPSVLTVEGLPIEGHRRRVLSLGPTHRTRYQGPPGRGGGPRHAPRRTFQRPGPCASSAAARGAPCSQGMASAGSGGTSSRATPRSVNSREAMRARRRQSLPAAPRAGGRVRGGGARQANAARSNELWPAPQADAGSPVAARPPFALCPSLCSEPGRRSESGGGGPLPWRDDQSVAASSGGATQDQVRDQADRRASREPCESAQHHGAGVTGQPVSCAPCSGDERLEFGRAAGEGAHTGQLLGSWQHSAAW